MFHNKSCYQSCIKINGVPILPPLITPERRKELEILKQQAVLKEEQLKHRKKLKDSLNEILNYRPLCGKSFDDSSSHVEALNIGKSSDKDEITTTNQRPNTLNLTTEIIDVSQFDENGIKMITSSESSSNETETVIKNDVLKFSTQISSSPIQSSPKPRLIRSNSYTLDTPSPILLAHLEKHGTNNRDNKMVNRGWSSLDNSYNKIDDTEEENQSKSPTIEVIQTDITIQQVTVNTPFLNEQNDDLKVADNDIDPQLLDILKNIPEEYSNKILNIIKQPKKCDEIKADCNNKVVENVANQIDEQNNSIVSMSSQSVYYTLSNSTETLQSQTTTPLKIVDLESQEESQQVEKKCSTIEELNKEIESKLNINRQLFTSKQPPNYAKQHLAASVIQAYVKGYLIRRLLKTEHIQNLIQTIKDALICALQLHKAEQIDEADVELHRRLIQQVSAACYAFHDIFFEFDKKKQMSLISIDRQRKLEKAKRPTSAPVSARSSSSSTSRRRTISGHGRNLTKV